MIQVKWVHKKHFTDTEMQYADGSPIGPQVPIIELSALTEVVEGLKEIAGEIVCDGPNCHWCIDGNTHMASPGALTAQRLLAKLAPQKEAGS